MFATLIVLERTRGFKIVGVEPECSIVEQLVPNSSSVTHRVNISS
jgi:hypothetical protein